MPDQPPKPSPSGTWRDTFNQPQFKATVATTVVSQLFTIAMQFGVNGVAQVYNSVFSYDPVDFQKVYESVRKGENFLEGSNYTEALKQFDFARLHFESTLTKYSKSNSRLQEMYSNVCYNQVFLCIFCGDLDRADKIINEITLNLKEWNSKYQDVDLIKLKVIVFLKQEKYAEALQQCDRSLTLSPRQEEVIFLRSFLTIHTQIHLKLNPEEEKRGESKDTVPPKEDKNSTSTTQFVVNSKLFQPNIINPIAFEINLAFLQTLFFNDQYQECFDQLRDLESRYTRLDLPFKDREKIYRLMINVLTMLDKAALEPETMESKGRTHDLSLSTSGFEDLCPKSITKSEIKKLLVQYQQEYSHRQNLDREFPSTDKATVLPKADRFETSAAALPKAGYFSSITNKQFVIGGVGLTALALVGSQVLRRR